MKKLNYSLRKDGRILATAGVATFLLIGAVGNQMLFYVPLSTVQAATIADPVVTTKDSSGVLSVDPQNTAKTTVDISSANMANYFEVTDRLGNRRTINGNQVDLLTGHESTENSWIKGTQLMLAKQQIDFTSDFSLNMTQTITTDNTMGGWGAGDGVSLFFEPLSVAEAISTAGTGYQLGTTRNYTAIKSMTSFNISSNALGQLAGMPSNTWIAYQSLDSMSKAVDGFLNTEISSDRPAGDFSITTAFTFDMSYSASTRTIHVDLLSKDGTSLREWNYVVPDSRIGNGYTVGVAAATAASQSAYSAIFNSYSYAPAKSSLTIKSSGLPTDVTGPDQTGIAAIAGNVIAFYPEGTTAPTVDGNGQKLTSAYPVKEINGYKLKKTQYITIGTDDSNNVVTLDYGKPATVNVNYVAENGASLGTSEVVDGYVGDSYTVTPKTIDGYEYKDVATNSDSLTGVYGDAAKNVTLVYKMLEGTVPDPEVAGNITINYVDENGKVLKPAETVTGFVGNGYEVKEEDILDYDYQGLGKNSAAEKGLFTADKQTITFVYNHKKSQIPDLETSGKLTINYVDENGQTILPSETKTGFVGNGYNVTPKTISNYEYVGLGADSASLTGKLDATDKSITLVYKFPTGNVPDPVVGGALTINFVNKNGETVKPSETVSGFVGNTYDVTPETIDHYQYQGLLDGSSSLVGTFTDKPQTITLMYDFPTGVTPDPEVAGALTIKYVDENGNEIKDAETKTGFIGNGYQVTPETLDSYTYQGLGENSSPLTGKLTKDNQEIVLVYKADEKETTPSTPATTKPGTTTPETTTPETSDEPDKDVKTPETSEPQNAEEKENSDKDTDSGSELDTNKSISTSERTSTNINLISTLPQTNERNSTWITALGLLLIGVTSLAGFIGFRKRKN